MYEAFYGFTQRPFSAVPKADHYFPAESSEQARQTLVRAVERTEGVGVIVGPAGTGKTLLCHVVARQFRESMRVVMLASTHLSTRRALLQSILFELKLPFRNLEEGDMRLALIDHLEPAADCPHGMLLIVDEAHTIPLRLLEELRLISNLVRDGEPRVRLLLAGGSLLEEHLTHPRLDSFQQRIAARCYLHPFHRHEVSRYIRQALDRVGLDADRLLTDDAYAAVARLTDGVPRLVNQLCDHALLLGHGAGREQIDAQLVEEAWADLQRLPIPSSQYGESNFSSPVGTGEDEKDGEGRESGESIVEFGPLDDTADDDDSLPVLRKTEEVELSGDLDSEQDRDAQEAETGVAGWVLESPRDETREPCIVDGEASVAHRSFIDDPFGGPFDSEEIVLDECVTWDLWVGENYPRVSSAESRAFAAALALFGETRSAQSAATRSGDARSSGDAPSSADELLASDALESRRLDGELPRDEVPQVETPQEDASRPRSEVAIGLWNPASQPVDDRDIIIVDEEENSSAETSGLSAPRASRQEYRRLFGRLRQPA